MPAIAVVVLEEAEGGVRDETQPSQQGGVVVPARVTKDERFGVKAHENGESGDGDAEGLGDDSILVLGWWVDEVGLDA